MIATKKQGRDHLHFLSLGIKPGVAPVLLHLDLDPVGVLLTAGRRVLLDKHAIKQFITQVCR